MRGKTKQQEGKQGTTRSHNTQANGQSATTDIHGVQSIGEPRVDTDGRPTALSTSYTGACQSAVLLGTEGKGEGRRRGNRVGAPKPSDRA